MNILLIEDDLTLNELITDYLKLNGNSVVSLEDGMNAIDTINKTNFDLYIIDINIPHINGLEIVKYIRQKDISTPIIMITASMELENFKTAYKNGCDDYIKKPFYLEELEIRVCLFRLKFSYCIIRDYQKNQMETHLLKSLTPLHMIQSMKS